MRLQYNATNALVVARARVLPDAAWDALPVVRIPRGTVLHSNIEKLVQRHIDKVVSGVEAYREDYPALLYRTDAGDLHIVDGHHRAAICAALELDLPARVADSGIVGRFA